MKTRLSHTRPYRRQYTKLPHVRKAARRQALIQQRRRREWSDSLKKHPCMDCGGSFPPECMDFDHVRGRKLFNIGNASTGGIAKKRVLKEIAKCDLVCANCHRIRTAKRRRKKHV